MNNLVLGFPEYRRQGELLARELGTEFSEVDVHRFPDGESRVRLPAEVSETVVFCRSLNAPNDKLIELLIAAETARNLGARRLILVAPYLCYMRQDIAFNPGEGVSQKVIGALLANYFDALFTVDPHLHRISDLGEAVPVHAETLSAASLFSAFLTRHVEAPLLLGPDRESEQWVASIAKALDCDYLVADKHRLGDTEVRISLPPASYRQRNIVIVDDMISTGKTLEALVASIPDDPASISVLATHALFDESTAERLLRAGVRSIWSSDSIPHETNAVSLAPLLADAVRKIV